ncbi:MAG: glycosyltransferase family 9 protein [Ktedonobacteraceae bacterium]
MKINTGSKADFVERDKADNNVLFFEEHASSELASLDFASSQLELHTQTSRREGFFPNWSDRTDNPLYLVTMYKGIGDAVLVGLSFVDQIIKEDPQAFGRLDVLCNSVQAQIFEHDPRVNRIVLTNNSLFSPSEMTMWLNGIRLNAKTAALVQFLRDRRYAAVFAFMFAPGFYLRLRSTIVYPGILQLGKDLWSLSRQIDVPMSKITRRMVSNYFDNKRAMADICSTIPLYVSSEQIKNAGAIVRNIKERSNISPDAGRLMVIASDSTSVITRPPVDLLATSIAEALRKCCELIVCILQGYTDASAAQKLFEILTGEFEGRIFLMPAEPKAKLLDVAAFIDQADMFITGDTGLMHLAAATMKLRDDDNAMYCPRNTVKIIALFGGTNPSFYGYSERTIIVGKGRKEQTSFIPGIAKESYNPRGKDLFDHISPNQLTEAILRNKRTKQKCS